MECRSVETAAGSRAATVVILICRYEGKVQSDINVKMSRQREAANDAILQFKEKWDSVSPEIYI